MTLHWNKGLPNQSWLGQAAKSYRLQTYSACVLPAVGALFSSSRSLMLLPRFTPGHVLCVMVFHEQALSVEFLLLAYEVGFA